MSQYRIYHNPRCSKSRNTLALLHDRGIEPEVVLYLENTPDVATLKQLLGYLGLGAAELVRKGEDDYRALGLNASSSEQELLQAMASHPKLIERPVVVRGKQAVLGRPPENVLALIDR
ncbi:MAG: arsenate reductase (glutaredoxin) [Parahaliea sp.]